MTTVRTWRRAAGRAANTFFDDLLVARALGPDAAAFEETWRRIELVPGFLARGAAALLFRLVGELRPATVVEVGSYLGRGTAFFAVAARRFRPDARVVAVDPHTGDRQQVERFGIDVLPSLDLYRAHLDAVGVTDAVETLVATSEDAAATWEGSAELVYVDGWHAYDHVLADARLWLAHLAPGGVMVFDDYLQFPDVRAAVADAVEMTDLTWYGSAFGQAYTGRAPTPPPGLGATLATARRAPYDRWHTLRPWRDQER
jgi:predicted O-methyltransferase YrrM